MYTSYIYYELRIKTGALCDACHLMRPVVMPTWWQGLPYQLCLPGFVLTFDDIASYCLEIVLMAIFHDKLHNNTIKAFKHTKHYNRIRNLIIFYTHIQ